jgi:DNA-binding MarR family transcriptional regulator
MIVCPPLMGDLADFLVMDRTTLTANLKPQERRGLVELMVAEIDRRGRRLSLTNAGGHLLVKAVSMRWATHDEIDKALGQGVPVRLRAGLLWFSRPGQEGDANRRGG